MLKKILVMSLVLGSFNAFAKKKYDEIRLKRDKCPDSVYSAGDVYNLVAGASNGAHNCIYNIARGGSLGGKTSDIQNKDSVYRTIASPRGPSPIIRNRSLGK